MTLLRLLIVYVVLRSELASVSESQLRLRSHTMFDLLDVEFILILELNLLWRLPFFLKPVYFFSKTFFFLVASHSISDISRKCSLKKVFLPKLPFKFAIDITDQLLCNYDSQNAYFIRIVAG